MLLRLQRYNIAVQYKPGPQMYVADHLSRASLVSSEKSQDNFKVFAMELESMNPLAFVKVSPERLTQIQTRIAHDPVLQVLKTTVLTGWPESKEETPIAIRDYWNYREEITLHNGILFKNQRVIIPKAMKSEILSRVHSSHQGIASCLRKAKDIVFWPGMNVAIKEMVTSCSVCAEFQA